MNCPVRVSKKWLNATFSSFLIRCLRLWRGQHLMQGKPCYARAFADLPRTPQGAFSCPCRAIHLVSPNPNKAIRALINPGFFRQTDRAGMTCPAFLLRLLFNVKQAEQPVQQRPVSGLWHEQYQRAVQKLRLPLGRRCTFYLTVFAASHHPNAPDPVKVIFFF